MQRVDNIVHSGPDTDVDSALKSQNRPDAPGRNK